MKKAVYLLISMLLTLTISLYGKHNGSATNLPMGDQVKILSSPDLYNLAVKWAEEYNKQFAGADIKVINATDLQSAEDFISLGNLGIISGDYSGHMSKVPFLEGGCRPRRDCPGYKCKKSIH